MMDHEADHRLGERVNRLKRNWRWILAGAGLASLAAFTVSLFLTKVYRATTSLLVSESKIGPGVELPAWQYATLPTYEPFVDNDAMIRQAIERFHLDQAPYHLTVDSFRRKEILEVRALKSTRLVEINVEFPDARLAADLANFFAQSAVVFNDQLNGRDATASRAFLSKQLDEAKAQLSEADRRRTEVRAKAAIEDREAELNVLLKEREQLSAKSANLQLELAQDESKAKYLEQALKQEPETFRLTKSIYSDRLAEKTLEKSGAGRAAEGSISEETLNTTKESFRRNYVETTAEVEAEKAGSGEAAANLEKLNGRIKTLLQSLAVIRGELDKADYDYKLARDGVDIATRNYQTAMVNASSKTQDIEQLAPAVAPEKPFRPRLVLNTLLGALVGLILFCGIAAARESLRELREPKWNLVDEDHPMRVSS